MSIEAMAWALTKAPVTDAQAHIILLGLANHADSEGRDAYPSRAKLAAYGRCTVRTVSTKLKELLDLGVLVYGDQAKVNHLPGNRRPVVYDLNFGVKEFHPSEVGVNDTSLEDGAGVNGASPEKELRGEEPRSSGVNAVAHKPYLNHPINTSISSPPPAAPVTDGFEEFWNAYPKKERQRVAKAAYDAALKKADHGTIVTGAKGYARLMQQENRESRFISAPAVWLNEERWTDEYPPPPSVQQKKNRPWHAVAD